MKNKIIWITEEMIDNIVIDDAIIAAAVDNDELDKFVAEIFSVDEPGQIKFETDGARDAADELHLEAYARWL